MNEDELHAATEKATVATAAAVATAPTVTPSEIVAVMESAQAAPPAPPVGEFEKEKEPSHRKRKGKAGPSLSLRYRRRQRSGSLLWRFTVRDSIAHRKSWQPPALGLPNEKQALPRVGDSEKPENQSKTMKHNAIKSSAITDADAAEWRERAAIIPENHRGAISAYAAEFAEWNNKYTDAMQESIEREDRTTDDYAELLGRIADAETNYKNAEQRVFGARSVLGDIYGFDAAMAMEALAFTEALENSVVELSEGVW